MHQPKKDSWKRHAAGGFRKESPWRLYALGCAALAALGSSARAQLPPVAPISMPQIGQQQLPPNQIPQQKLQAASAGPTFSASPPQTQMPLPHGLLQVQAVDPAGKGPEKIPGAAELPPPRNSNAPFDKYQYRLPLMSPDGVPVFGTTPIPNKKTVEEFKKYVERFVDPQNTLDLIKGRVRLIMLRETPKRIQMGDESVAVYNLVSPREITMIGRATGTTVLNLWFVDDQGKETVLSYLVRVFPDPEERERIERVYKALEDEVNRTFPDSVVHVRLVGDKIVVTGQAHDSIEATQIIRLIRANAPGAAENPNIPVDSIFPVQRPGEQQAVPGLLNYQIHSRAEVINMLRVPGEQQINLKVTVAEVNRTAARSIGLNFTLTNNNGIQYLANLTGGIGLGNIPVTLDNGQIQLAINALKSLNYARSLAEPNLTALNGMPANFLAGGQFPVPIITGATAVGLQGVTYVPFGVQLNFTPYITDKDRIRLAVNAIVSTRDVATGALINGTNVPGLTTRNFATTVELREGQTMMVAGLIQNNLTAERTNIPFFTDIPGINRLTGLDRTSHGEQELVMLVTPELVHPLEYKETPPLPGADIYEPSDFEFYVLGRLESRRPYDYRSPVINDCARQNRYRNCEQLYIFGPTGHTMGDAIGTGAPIYGPNGPATGGWGSIQNGQNPPYAPPVAPGALGVIGPNNMPVGPMPNVAPGGMVPGGMAPGGIAPGGMVPAPVALPPMPLQ
jgi:pilus assembly protein CpaC